MDPPSTLRPHLSPQDRHQSGSTPCHFRRPPVRYSQSGTARIVQCQGWLRRCRPGRVCRRPMVCRRLHAVYMMVDSVASQLGAHGCGGWRRTHWALSCVLHLLQHLACCAISGDTRAHSCREVPSHCTHRPCQNSNGTLRQKRRWAGPTGRWGKPGAPPCTAQWWWSLRVPCCQRDTFCSPPWCRLGCRFPQDCKEEWQQTASVISCKCLAQ